MVQLLLRLETQAVEGDMMYEYFEFKDSEPEIVKSLTAVLNFLEVSNFRVATQRLPESRRDKNINEIIVRSNSRNQFGREVEENFTIYVFVNNDNENIAYKTANNLTTQILTGLKMVKQNSDHFRNIQNISSSVFEDEGNLQIRSILFTATSYGISKIVNK